MSRSEDSETVTRKRRVVGVDDGGGHGSSASRHVVWYNVKWSGCRIVLQFVCET